VPVTANDVLESLREAHLHTGDAQFSRFVRRHLADPVRPEDNRGRIRINRLILWLVVLSLGAAATFLYFTLIQP
jgi:hypothetical protein